MDRASGSGVFARDPDAMLDMTELTPTDAIREQLHNKAACAACRELLDTHGHGDAYSQDDACSRSRMLEIAKEHLGWLICGHWMPLSLTARSMPTV